LNKAEKNYPPHKREFLALKWSICDKFKDYLYGQRFTVPTISGETARLST
jgi:hypothetical protein